MAGNEGCMSEQEAWMVRRDMHHKQVDQPWVIRPAVHISAHKERR